MASELLARSVLLAPNAMARAAIAGTRIPRERWMLRQPREVRADYVRMVLDYGDEPERQEAWMLRQPEEVRESYVREVLEPALRPGGSRSEPRRPRRRWRRRRRAGGA